MDFPPWAYSPGNPADNSGVSAGSGAGTGNAGTLVASGLPGYVPMVTSTAPSSTGNQTTGLPTPNNVQNDPAASTVLTSAGGLLGTVKAIVANPGQHIIGVIVLLVVGWFVWKHLK